MKNVFFLSILLIITKTVLAIVPPVRDSVECLAAIRKGKQFEFPLMRGIAIWDKAAVKTQGLLTKIKKDSIVIASYRKKDIWEKTIAIKDIVDAQPYSRKSIRNAKIGTIGTTVLGSTALGIFFSSYVSSPATSLGAIVAVVSVVAVISFFATIWLENVLTDRIERKSIERGWKFEAASSKTSWWKKLWRRQRGV